MNYEEAGKIISRLQPGTTPIPNRAEIKQAYDAIYAKCGIHAEPLRTHIHDTPGLAIGWELGARLLRYALEAVTPSGTATSRRYRI